MSTKAAYDGPRRRGQHLRETDVAEYFAPQHTASADLPDPSPLLRSLTVGLLECLAGVRDVDQLARWMSQDAYLSVAKRAALAARARSARGSTAQRPVYSIVSVHVASPADGVVEGTIIVSMPARTRALAMRLEGMDHRWRASSIALL